ncbi:MAG: helix-turn-helix domain-containing protein [Firmicutes bacterium]|nr:helix-turn-helix domain-containing protein [Bacillota bacterium]
MAKSTDDLMKILKDTSDIKRYVEENTEEMTDGNLGKYIEKLLEETGLTIAKVARRGQLSDSYLYKISEDRKSNISRDKVIQICFGFGLDAEGSRKLLRAARVGELYPRIRRDSIILFCLEKHIDIIECDKKLIEAGDKKLLRE